VRGRRPAFGAQTGEGTTGRRKTVGTHGHHQDHPGNNPVHKRVPQRRLPVRGGHAIRRSVQSVRVCDQHSGGQQGTVSDRLRRVRHRGR